MTEENQENPAPPIEQAPEGYQYVPLKPRAYHIPQDAIEICNGMERTPSDTITALYEYVQDQKVVIASKDAEIEKLMKVVPVDGRPIYTLEEIGATVRKVCQTEGVMLHNQQKEFFRNVFNEFMQVIQRKLP